MSWAPALLVWGAALLVLPPRRAALATSAPPRAGARRAQSSAHARPLSAAALCAAAGVWIGLPMGPVLALLGWLALAAGSRWRAGRRQRAAEQLLSQQVPMVAELLIACVSAGATLPAALQAAAAALPDPAAQVLRAAADEWRLGAGPSVVADRLRAGLGARPAVRGAAPLPGAPLAPVADAIEQAATTGAPLAEVLAAEADQLRASHLAATRVRLRSVTVRSVLPLGLCYLPAFLLLGVAPVVAGLLGTVAP